MHEGIGCVGGAALVDSPVVQISNLDFRFDSHLPYVLRDVSMTVQRGRCDTPRGPSRGRCKE